MSENCERDAEILQWADTLLKLWRVQRLSAMRGEYTDTDVEVVRRDAAAMRQRLVGILARSGHETGKNE